MDERGDGDSYFVPAGFLHGATVAPGTRVIEVFAEHRFDLAPGRRRVSTSSAAGERPGPSWAS